MKSPKRILKRVLVTLLVPPLIYLALGWFTPQTGRFEKKDLPGGAVLRLTPLRVYSLVGYGPFRFEIWPEIGFWTPYDESRLTLRPIFPFNRSDDHPKVYFVSLTADGGFGWRTDRSLEFTGVVFEKSEYVLTQLRELHPQAGQIEMGVLRSLAKDDALSKMAGEVGFDVTHMRSEGDVNIYVFKRRR